MTTTLQELKDAAAALPLADRAELARFLLGSLDEGEDVDARAEWLALAERRMADVRAGKVVGIPFNMILLLPGLQAIPDELYEAAAIDGAGPWARFRHITIPLLKPVALSVILLGVIYTFKVFDIVFVLTGGGPVDATTVLPIEIYNVSLKFFRFGEGAAASTLLLLAMLVVAGVYLWLVRREERTA